MLYKGIENPQDGDYVQFVGVHVLAWRPEWGKPAFAFIEVDNDEGLTRYKAVADELRASLLVILDAVDYTAGNCRVNEMVGAVLPKELIEKGREALLLDLKKVTEEGKHE